MADFMERAISRRGNYDQATDNDNRFTVKFLQVLHEPEEKAGEIGLDIVEGLKHRPRWLGSV
ncbi:MAG TPA: hypothetical protein DEB25_02245 [Desulfobulbaceae bacterium]|nr:hypothetical protein [Desulfobulbaceae bacterium]